MLNVFQRHITDGEGNVLPGASVAVRDQVTAQLVQLYSDYDGESAIGNPITADENGFVRFYVETGRYQITATLDDQERVWEDEELGLDGDRVLHRADPRRHGAVGDGVEDDTTAFANAEILNVTIPLAPGTNYNLESTKPVNFCYGPGSITLTGDTASPTVSGFEIAFDVAGGSIVSTPDVWAEQANGLTSSPGGLTSYFNVILAPGSNAWDTENTDVWRSTLIGQGVGEQIISWERNEAIGSGAMRFAPYAERTTAIGTLALQWVGATSQQFLIDTFHDFWNGEDAPGDVGWDFFGLETRNPGIGTQLDEFTGYSTDTTTSAENVAVGRDAGLHMVAGTENVFVGYQAGTNNFDAHNNVAVGTRALRDGVFTNNNTAVGRSAGIILQEGNNNTFLGSRAGESLVTGNGNIFIGYRAGTTLDDDMSNILVIDNQTGTGGTPLLMADLSRESVYLGQMDPAEMATLGSGYHYIVTGNAPATPGRFLGTATSATTTFVSYAGSELSRQHAAFENTNGVVGTITTNGSATAYNTSSDARDKVAIGTPDSLETINALQVHLARFKTDEEGSERAMLFAQEAEAVTPYAVTPPVTDEGKYQMDYSKLVPDLIRAVQVLSARVAELEAK